MCVSGVAGGDLSCVIFRRLEEKKLGIIIGLIYYGNVEQRVVIKNVNDADFYTSGEDWECKKQEIITYYTKINEAIGGEVQKEKFSMHYWKWNNQKIKIIPIKIKL